MAKDILYEHPLNERIRSYLKLEQLFTQVHSCLQVELTTNTSVFFNALFSIIDTLERTDIRGDLIKDIDKLQQNLVIWSKLPNIDTSALEDNLRKTVRLLGKLKVNSPQWWQLKESKLLSSLKQRFAIQGGCASFDLPQLHFWLHQPQETKINDIEQWLSMLADIELSLNLVLKFIRQRAEFETIDTDSGFYQDNGEGLLLLRIKLPADAAFYPTVSGNRFRYSIRFMLPCEQNGRRYANQATQFQLAKC